jgi:alpha/beta superfamily hydrolase
MSLRGPAGDLELIVDAPVGRCVGTALIAHPHPLLGGSAKHKLPEYLARSVQSAGWLAVRPNFRGVGRTQGRHTGGPGEADDISALARATRSCRPGEALVLIGFSFGAYVMCQVGASLHAGAQPAECVVLAGMPVGTVETERRYDPAPPGPEAVLIHGECDERVPLQQVLSWSGRHRQAVTVVPGADHFFKGRLPELQRIVLAALRGVS